MSDETTPDLTTQRLAIAQNVAYWIARAESAEAALAEAWEQAHNVFCPRRDVCSTHLRPGDRHLFASTPDREEERDE